MPKLHSHPQRSEGLPLGGRSVAFSKKNPIGDYAHYFIENSFALNDVVEKRPEHPRIRIITLREVKLSDYVSMPSVLIVNLLGT